MTPQDLESRRKGLQLVARVEYLYETDEGFQRWYQQGVDEVEADQIVTLIFKNGKWEEQH